MLILLENVTTAALKEKRRGKLRQAVLFHHMLIRRRKHLAATQNASFELLRHPSYSPHMSPSDFCLFPKLKKKS